MTDEVPAYRKAQKAMRPSIGEPSAREYVRGAGAHTIGLKDFSRCLKRGVVGTFHHVSEQHLPLYLAEFDHRHNCRDNDRRRAHGERI